MTKPVNRFEKMAQDFLSSPEGKSWEAEWIDPLTGGIREDKLEEARRPSCRLKFDAGGRPYLEDLSPEEIVQIETDEGKPKE